MIIRNFNFLKELPPYNDISRDGLVRHWQSHVVFSSIKISSAFLVVPFSVRISLSQPRSYRRISTLIFLLCPRADPCCCVLCTQVLRACMRAASLTPRVCCVRVNDAAPNNPPHRRRSESPRWATRTLARFS